MIAKTLIALLSVTTVSATWEGGIGHIHVDGDDDHDAWHMNHVNLLYCHCLSYRHWANGFKDADGKVKHWDEMGAQSCRPCPAGQVQDPR